MLILHYWCHNMLIIFMI